MATIIRKFEEKDAEALAKLDEIWKKEGISLGMNPRKAKDFIKNQKKEICFIAEQNNKIIGYACGKKLVYKSKKKLFYLKRGEQCLNFDSLYVLKPYRKLRVGRKLIFALVREAKKEDLDSIILVAVSKNQEKLVSFYKKCGFGIVITRMKLKL
jgi:GNAT superfamily N-acetyltransferase